MTMTTSPFEQEATVGLSIPPDMEELYRDNPVVALPSRGRAKESVTPSSNANNRQRAVRSLSAGRTRSSRLVDIVQDVYDRMGVNYKRGEDIDLSDLPAQGGINAAASTSPTQGYHAGTTPRSIRGRMADQSTTDRSAGASRGRVSEQSASDRDRPRSLSRGRVAGRWPPASQSSSSQKTTSAAPVSGLASRRSFTNGEIASSRRSSNIGPENAPSSQLDGNEDGRAVSSAAQTYPFTLYRRGDIERNGARDDKRDHEEKQELSVETDSLDAKHDILRVSPLSLKERIVMYRGQLKQSGSSRTLQKNADSQNSALKTSRDHPRRLDIYEASHKQTEVKKQLSFESINCYDSEEKKDEITHEKGAQAANISRLEASTAELHRLRTGIPETTAEASRASFNSRSPKKGKNVTNAFLSAVQQSGHHQNMTTQKRLSIDASAPVREIAAVVDTRENRDGNSVALSSVSGEEFTTPERQLVAEAPQKKPPNPWQDLRDKMSSNKIIHHPVVNGPKPLSTEAIEKLVEERVAAQLADLDARMETQLKTYVQQLEDRLAAKFGAF